MSAVALTEAIGSVVAYESMCRWIAESESLADCKDIADKSAALKEYARRAGNIDAERRAANVRLIAERRYGELLRDMARATPQTANPAGVARTRMPDAHTGATDYAKALADTGVSRRQAHRYEALANVPKETFEAAIKDPAEIPTRAGILVKAEAARVVREARDPVPKFPPDSLWLWGRMRDLERDGYFGKNAAALLDPLTETMLADMRRILPLCAAFINALNEAVHELA